MTPTFWFSGFNHSMAGRDTLLDIQASLAGQFRDLGFNCGRDEGKEALSGMVANPPYINILMEGFHPGIISELKRAKKEVGARFICIMTEQPGVRGFNDVPDPDMVMRQEFFKEAAPLMDAIWCLVPGSELWARRYNPNSVHVENGFSETRWKLFASSQRTIPLFHVAFFGGLTQRRHNMLEQLRKRGLSYLQPMDLPIVDDSRARFDPKGATTKSQMYADVDHRNKVIASCRCVVELKPYSKREFPSGTRIGVALHVGRPVVVEKHTVDSSWAKVVDFAKGYDDFFDLVKHVCDNWQESYAEQLAKFRVVLSPEATVGKAIRDTHILDMVDA